MENAIAIIGISGRFPEAQNHQNFWDNICQGKESISNITADDLIRAGHPATLIDGEDHIKAMGILEGIEYFDADFFDFSPIEAQILDPQHKLFLECAWEALENAGYGSDHYEASIGVYGGTASSSYFLHHLFPNKELKEKSGDYLLHIGNEKDFLTTHVSYKLNLKGPSLAIQTACSTSLVAVCVACNHLLTYQCDMALAGGVRISLPQIGYQYQQGMIFSPKGHCKPFDAKADGTVPGNGVGIVVLKRLQDAVSDKDHIYAIIRGFAINNDGREKMGYWAPSIKGQAETIRSAIAMAKINPETISYAETHGTGTLLGDPIEIAALNGAFQSYTDKKGFCALGSVKGNIGHLMEAAGIASLIKTSLALYYGKLPPLLHAKDPNPHIDFQSSPFYLNDELKEWPNDRLHRRACVSSFGIGGTNSHIILEESQIQSSSVSNFDALLVLSAKTPTALQKMSVNLSEFLEKHPNLSLADVAYTLQVGRKTFEYKRILLCKNTREAALTLVQPFKSTPSHLKDQTSVSIPLDEGIRKYLTSEELVIFSSFPTKFQSIDSKTLLNALAKLWLEGFHIDWDNFYIGEKPHRIPLPTYPFEKKRYWIDPPTFIDDKPSSIASSSSISQVQDILLKIWQEFLGKKSIGIEDDFFELGGDSVLAIQVISKIQSEFGIKLDLRDALLEFPTISRLVELISQNSTKNDADFLNSIVVPLKSEGVAEPLFFIHPIEGHVLGYKALAQSVSFSGPIYGIRAPKLDSKFTSLNNIEEITSYYLRAVKLIQPSGPYQLLGFSFGGVIAYEMARQLLDSHQSIGFLCLLDIENPANMPGQLKDDLSIESRLFEFFNEKSEMSECFDQLCEEERIIKILENLGMGKLPFPEQKQQYELMKTYLRILENYQPKPIDSKILFFEAKERFYQRKDISLGSCWKELAKKGLDLYEIPGAHKNILMVSPDSKLVEILNAYLKK